jgi:DNA-binding transcriptional MerR regulator
MPDDPYSLSDLARLADVTPRTVRYYVALGLLPSPEAAGPATRYGEGHLARLRLIRRLQRDHLPLAEIRIRLERMADDEIIATVSALDAREPDPSQDPGDTLAFVRSLMQQSGIRPTVADRRASPDMSFHRLAIAETLDGALAETAMAPAAPPPAAPPPAASVGESAAATSPRPGRDRTTWERVVISPDVELHVRRPLDRTTNKRVDQLERIARELFEDH